jgi:hypothetical protein
MLIFHTAALLDLLNRSKYFLVKSSESFKYRIVSSINIDNLTSSCPFILFYFSVISLPCLIAVTNISRAMLIKSEDNGHPCPFLILEEMVSIFSH